MKAFQALPFLAASLLASAAHAHISLEAPAARYDGSQAGASKACPCGVGDSNRLCDVPGDRSDPDRSSNVTTVEAGSTITMRWDEYVGHSGRYRVAFDPDGADHDDFNANILMDFVDPPGNDGNLQGSIWEIEVTVPDTPCDNCTLQLIQMMDGNMDDPVLDTVGRSSYYQCADIVIVPAGGPADMGATPDAGSTPDLGNPMPDQGTTVTPPPDLGTTPGTDQGVPGSVADTGLGRPESINGHGGCGVASAQASPFALFGMLIFGAFRRRRRSKVK